MGRSDIYRSDCTSELEAGQMTDDPHDVIYPVEWYEHESLPDEKRAPPGAWLGIAVALGLATWVAIIVIVLVLT